MVLFPFLHVDVDCDNHFVEETGTFPSPIYFDNYPNNLTYQTYIWCACDSHVVCMWYSCDVHVILITVYILFLFLDVDCDNHFMKEKGTFQSPFYPDYYPNNLTSKTHMWCACDTHVVCMWYPCGVHVTPMWCACDTHNFPFLCFCF